MSNNIADYTGTILWNKENATVSIWQVGEEYKTSVTVDEVKKLVKTQEVTFEVHTNDGFGKTGAFCIANDEIILSVVIGETINQFSIDSNGVELVSTSDTGGDTSGSSMLVVTISGNDNDGYTSDKTFEEIKSNYLLVPIILKHRMDNESRTAFYHLDSINDAYGNVLERINFYSPNTNGTFTVKSDNSIEFTLID